MTRYKILLYSSLFVVVGLLSFKWKSDPITDLINLLKQKLYTYRVDLNPEKIYVHLDRAQYVAGETVWFKSYLVDAFTNNPSTATQVVHIDLVNKDGRAFQQLKLEAEDGEANGHMDLPDSLESGDYQLVAYTQWMRNFGDEPFFRKNIRIYHAEEAVLASLADLTPSDTVADLQFFPEGGHYVAGLPSTVAFKAINKKGLGTEVSGHIINSRSDTVASFGSAHAGMGVFKMIPEMGQQYTAVVNGTGQRISLPAVQQSGLSMVVDEYSDADYLTISIRTSKRFKSPLLLTIIGAGQLAHQVYELDDKHIQFQIDKRNLPVGINRINLATAQGVQLAERLVFLHPERQLQIKVKSSKPVYLPREEVQLTVETTDEKGNPVPASLSMAVVDAELVPQDLSYKSILSHFLLTSEVRGFVENPDYYFSNITPEKKMALKYVMMTHGWRKFSWDQITAINHSTEINHTKQNALYIHGKLVDKNGDPVNEGEALLYMNNEHGDFLLANTDHEGNFSFDGLKFQGSVEMVMQGSSAQGSDKVKLQIEESSFIPDWKDLYTVEQNERIWSHTTQMITRANNHNQVSAMYEPGIKEMLLEEVRVEEQRNNNSKPFSLHRRADVVFDVDDLPWAPSGNVLQVLQTRVAGMRVYRNSLGDYWTSIRGGCPLYLIDGMPVDARDLKTVNQRDLDRIEILKGVSGYVYGMRGRGGVIALFTKQGAPEYKEVKPVDHRLVHQAQGYQQQKAFYVPRYTAEEKTERPDYRTTLYWNPDVKTNENGKAIVKFPVSDRETEHRIVINGLSSNGIAGSLEESILVANTAIMSP